MLVNYFKPSVIADLVFKVSFDCLTKEPPKELLYQSCPIDQLDNTAVLILLRECICECCEPGEE